MTQPTLFGGGEAGPEAVLPIERLQGFIDVAFERNGGGSTVTKYEFGDITLEVEKLKDVETLEGIVNAFRTAKGMM